MKKRGRTVAVAGLMLLAGFLLLPFILTLIASLSSGADLNLYDAERTERVRPVLIPSRVSLRSYYRLLVDTPQYLRQFWNSVGLSCLITALGTAVAVPTAYVFAKVPFRGREPLFFLYIVTMILPYQVTLLPNYILAKELSLYDTWWAVVLPGMFAPLGVFLLRQSMRSMGDELLDSFALDSGSSLQKLWHVVIPENKPGIIALLMLLFAESWNMVEPPLVLLETPSLLPLSVTLNAMFIGDLGLVFAGAVVFVIPILLLYMAFREQVLDGMHTFMKQ